MVRLEGKGKKPWLTYCRRKVLRIVNLAAITMAKNQLEKWF